jgi:hypothetical protein
MDLLYLLERLQSLNHLSSAVTYLHSKAPSELGRLL